MTDDQITAIYTAFRTLPQDVREWLTSEQTGEKINELGNQFVLSDNQLATLSFLLIRLVTQNLPPEQFMNGLAKALSLDTDTAIRLTNALKTSVLDPIAHALRFNGIDPDLLRFKEAATAPLKPINPIKPVRPTETSQPFILHEEPGRITNKAQPSFSFSSPSSAESASKPARAPTVIIERVVHYTNFRTPLNQSSIHKPEPTKRVGVPKSRWFV